MNDMGHNIAGEPLAADRLRSLVERIERPKGMRRGPRPVDRFMTKVEAKRSGCLEWVGSKSPQGYAWFSWQSKPVLAHRWIYEHAKGKIPFGMVIDHLCRNRACVNPSHLECVRMAENTRRGILHDVLRAKYKQQSHCKRGHPLFGPNLRITTKGHRGCIACQSLKAEEWRASHRARVNELQRVRRAWDVAR